MKTSLLNNIFDKSNCLNANELSNYALGKLSPEQSNHIEKHLINCELCSLAVEGVSVTPLEASDVHDVDSRTQMMLNSGGTSYPHVLRNALFAVVPLVLVGAFLLEQFRGSEGREVIIPQDHSPMQEMQKEEVKDTPESEVHVALQEDNINKKEVFVVVKQDADDAWRSEVTAVDMLSRKEAYVIPVVEASRKVVSYPKRVPSTDIIYIRNCKVAKAKELYFKENTELFLLRNVPSPNELKRETLQNEQGQSAILLLDGSLEDFNFLAYDKALIGFEQLYKFNVEDINAKFYAGLCLYHLNKYEKAEQHFSALFGDKYFGDEASWFYALCLKAEGRYAEAKVLFGEINALGGFYADQAKEMLGM